MKYIWKAAWNFTLSFLRTVTLHGKGLKHVNCTDSSRQVKKWKMYCMSMKPSNYMK